MPSFEERICVQERHFCSKVPGSYAGNLAFSLTNALWQPIIMVEALERERAALPFCFPDDLSLTSGDANPGAVPGTWKGRRAVRLLAQRLLHGLNRGFELWIPATGYLIGEAIYENIRFYTMAFDHP